MVEEYLTWLYENGFSDDNLEQKGFNGNTPLLMAALQGNVMIVSRLIEAGTNLYAVNNDFNGVLFNAAYANSPEIIRMLIVAGADVDDVNEEGTTALMYAASASRAECVRMLLSLNANTTLQNQDGYSAIELTSDRDVYRQLRSA